MSGITILDLNHDTDNAPIVLALGQGNTPTDHNALANTGTNTHPQIDTHIADAEIHTSVTKAGTAPITPVEGDMWLNTTNQELSIYTNSIWEAMTYKSELAADAGTLSVNAGYF